jgi:hypothetical protein
MTHEAMRYFEKRGIISAEPYVQTLYRVWAPVVHKHAHLVWDDTHRVLPPPTELIVFSAYSILAHNTHLARATEPGKPRLVGRRETTPGRDDPAYQLPGTGMTSSLYLASRLLRPRRAILIAHQRLQDTEDGVVLELVFTSYCTDDDDISESRIRDNVKGGLLAYHVHNGSKMAYPISAIKLHGELL